MPSVSRVDPVGPDHSVRSAAEPWIPERIDEDRADAGCGEPQVIAQQTKARRRTPILPDLVIGRPIKEAKDPIEAVQKIIEDIS